MIFVIDSSASDHIHSTGTVDCKLTGTTGALCTGGGSGEQFSMGPQTVSLNGTDLESLRMPVTITASASMSGSGSSAGATATSGGGSSSNSAGAGKSAGASAGSTGTSSSGTAKSTGAAGLQVEPALGLGIAGIVAVGAAAAML